jgi:hypothetical protein
MKSVMYDPKVPFRVDVELAPGEKLTLPPSVVDSIGPGHWLITISPVQPDNAVIPIRGHSAFLNSYAPEDEGLYDDCECR